MATTVNYKGEVLATITGQTKTLKTAGKYMEGDVSIIDTSKSIALVSEHANSVGGMNVDISSVTDGPLPYTDTLDAGGGTIRSITADVLLKLQSKQATPSAVEQTILPDTGYNGLSEVIVKASGGGMTLESKTATPTESSQTITPDSGYDGLSSVEIGAISSTYVGSGITRRTSNDLTANGATVTVPSGWYQDSVHKDVNTTTAGTPTASKGTVSNHSISVTPSVTNTAGYITAGTKAGTAVIVSASELVSGTLGINQNGTDIDVTNYQKVDVAVPGGGSSKNVQVAAGVDRIASVMYTEVPGQSLTVAVTGTYDVYWSGYRTSTGGTNGSVLYIDSTGYGNLETTFSNNAQSIHISNVSLTAGQTVTVRARSRSTSNYMYVANLTIVQQ